MRLVSTFFEYSFEIGKIANAKKMKSIGFPIENIAEITGIPSAEIEKI